MNLPNSITLTRIASIPLLIWILSTNRFESKSGEKELLASARDAAQLSDVRYRGGAAGYLEVLTNETNAFDAELGLAQAQANELLSLVEIYRNLGGGWEL